MSSGSDDRGESSLDLSDLSDGSARGRADRYSKGNEPRRPMAKITVSVGRGKTISHAGSESGDPFESLLTADEIAGISVPGVSTSAGGEPSFDLDDISDALGALGSRIGAGGASRFAPSAGSRRHHFTAAPVPSQIDNNNNDDDDDDDIDIAIDTDNEDDDNDEDDGDDEFELHTKAAATAAHHPPGMPRSRNDDAKTPPASPVPRPRIVGGVGDSAPGVEGRSLFYGIVHTELSQLHASLVDMAESLAEREEAVQARAAEVEMVAREAQRVRAELESARPGSSDKDAQVQKLRAALERAKRELHAVRERYREPKPCASCASHAEKAERTAKDIQRRDAANRKAVAALRAERDTLSTRVSDLESQLVTERAQRVRALARVRVLEMGMSTMGKNGKGAPKIDSGRAGDTESAGDGTGGQYGASAVGGNKNGAVSSKTDPAATSATTTEKTEFSGQSKAVAAAMTLADWALSGDGRWDDLIESAARDGRTGDTDDEAGDDIEKIDDEENVVPGGSEKRAVVSPGDLKEARRRLQRGGWHGAASLIGALTPVIAQLGTLPRARILAFALSQWHSQQDTNNIANGNTNTTTIGNANANNANGVRKGEKWDSQSAAVSLGKSEFRALFAGSQDAAVRVLSCLFVIAAGEGTGQQRKSHHHQQPTASSRAVNAAVGSALETLRSDLASHGSIRDLAEFCGGWHVLLRCVLTCDVGTVPAATGALLIAVGHAGNRISSLATDECARAMERALSAAEALPATEREAVLGDVTLVLQRISERGVLPAVDLVRFMGASLVDKVSGVAGMEGGDQPLVAANVDSILSSLRAATRSARNRRE